MGVAPIGKMCKQRPEIFFGFPHLSPYVLKESRLRGIEIAAATWFVATVAGFDGRVSIEAFEKVQKSVANTCGQESPEMKILSRTQ